MVLVFIKSRLRASYVLRCAHILPQREFTRYLTYVGKVLEKQSRASGGEVTFLKGEGRAGGMRRRKLMAESKLDSNISFESPKT